jgi:TonB family protein
LWFKRVSFLLLLCTSTWAGAPSRADETYISYLERTIKRAWTAPRFDGNRTVLVRIALFKTGQVNKIRIVKTSGSANLDKTVETAIKNASPFKALPDGSPNKMEIELSFKVHSDTSISTKP